MPPLILTEKATILSQQTNLSINIILEIDGFPNHLFGAVDIAKDLVFDMPSPTPTFDGTYDFDGAVTHEFSKPYISLAETTNTISQQMDIVRGVESIKSFTVSLIDINEELTELFMPGNVQPDILGRKAKVHLLMVGSEFPEDAIQIMEGIIGTAVFKPGLCNLTIDHSSQLKRQDLFVQATTKVNGSLNNSTTTINCDSTDGFLTAVDCYTTYIRIDDEIMQYTSHSASSFTVVRGQLGTDAVEHDDDTEILSIYRLQGNAIDLSLKLMMSGSGYSLSSNAESFVTLTGSLEKANGIHFATERDIESDYGLTVGDYVLVTGSTSNNGTFTIASFGKSSYGSYIVVTGGVLINETDSTATINFKSQYDTLPPEAGCGMLPTQVNVNNHNYWYSLFSTSFVDYDFYLDSTIDFQEFLQQELYRPMGLYSVAGKTADVSMTIPPLSDIWMKTLDSSTVKNPDKIGIKRSISKYWYNSMVYRYDPESINTDRFMTGLIVVNAESGARIGYGNSSMANKSFKIESRGLRNTPEVNQLLQTQSRRFLDRYKFAAEHLDIEVLFSTGFQIECGDIVMVEGLSIADTTKGTRAFGPRLFEVVNKTLSIAGSGANVRLSLLSTAYGVDGRWGVISPASIIDSGATTTTLPLTQSFGWTKEEKEKWDTHIGEKILLHDSSWSFSEETTFNGWSSTAENTMVVSTLSSGAPAAGCIIDIPDYNVSSSDEQKMYKTLYCFSQPSLSIASVSSASKFTVTAAHASLIKINSVIEIADSTYTNVGEAVVSTITSTGGATEEVELKSVLSFTPASGYSIELNSWLDAGKPYRIL